MVTGGAGFIGSHFVNFLLISGAEVLNYDNLTYASNLNFLRTAAAKKNYSFVHGDICDEKKVLDTLNQYEPTVLVNFAAQTHVDRSITDPKIFSNTNVIGTSTLLECFRIYLNHTVNDKKRLFVQISTDEVYGSRLENYPALENDILAPSNIYSASKASADLIALAYYQTYNLPVVITRCCNNYGMRQNTEKFIPKIIESFMKNTPVPIYGDGNQTRQWIHVDDHIAAVARVIEKGELGSIYNIGDNNFFTNLNLVKVIYNCYLEETGKANGNFKASVEFVEDRLGHDTSYAISSNKLLNDIHFNCTVNFNEGIKCLVQDFISARA